MLHERLKNAGVADFKIGFALPNKNTAIICATVALI
jgi:hypothetical protein